MANCHEMKKGDVYVCEECGLQLQVIKECHEVGTAVEDCGCHEDDSPCEFRCCGKELTRK